MDRGTRTLVILTPAFAEQEGDSWLHAQEDFARMLNTLYPELKLIIITFHFPAVKTTYTWYGNEVIALGGGMKGKWNSLLLWQRAWKTLKQCHSQYELIGIFSFFCSECAFIGHHFAKRNTLRHRIWILGQDARSGNKQVGRIKPAADELIAISDFLVREFERNHAIRPAHMVPIGLSPQTFPQAPASRSIDLLGVGSLIPLKQYDVFIEVVKAVQARISSVHAMICGEGEEQETLMRQIEASGLTLHVKLAGKLPHETIRKQMEQSKILLHTSAYEGFGMVCAEALYAGAHVVSFCKPLDRDIAAWHIVKDKEEMIAKVLELLQADTLEHQPVLTAAMEETARQIMHLFGYSDANS